MRGAGGWHLRFQRRLTVFKGVRLNVGKRGRRRAVGAIRRDVARAALSERINSGNGNLDAADTGKRAATFGGFILAASEFDHVCNDRLAVFVLITQFPSTPKKPTEKS
jgi:hypothetical protein